MSIASAITAAQGRVANAYTAISNKGGTLPATQDLANMPTAINSIPSGGGGTITSLNVTPTTSAQTITASGGVDGYSPVNVSAVTSSIDANITAGNIKSGISILGVTGALVAADPFYSAEVIITKATKLKSTGDITGAFDNVVGVDGSSAMRNLFVTTSNGDKLSGTVSFPKLKYINGTQAMQRTFYYQNQLTGGVDMSALETITSTAKSISSAPMIQTFRECSGLTGTLDLSSLTMIGDINTASCCINGFGSYTNLSYLNLSSLTTIGKGNSATNPCVNNPFSFPYTNNPFTTLTTIGDYGSFILIGAKATAGTFEFTSLTTVGNNGLNEIFGDAGGFPSRPQTKELKFPALTSSGLVAGSFTSMLSIGTMYGNALNVTVHFPSSLQTFVESMTGYPTFGLGSSYGTVTLAFDLPATE